MGLLQDEGVHAHQDHLFLLFKEARSAYSDGKIVVHPFLDGRDTPPKSSPGYIEGLNRVLADIKGARIGTIMGRYYAMDRSERWSLTDQAFNCIVDAKGRPAADALQAVKKSYEQDKTSSESTTASMTGIR